MPYVIIPSTPVSLGIEDKEGNQVYALTCFKAQSEDVIKALRRKGYTSRTFSYDKEAWEKENEERSLLKEQVKNLGSALKDVAISSFQ